MTNQFDYEVIRMSLISNIQLLSAKVDSNSIPFSQLETRNISELTKIRDNKLLQYNNEILMAKKEGI